MILGYDYLQSRGVLLSAVGAGGKIPLLDAFVFVFLIVFLSYLAKITLEPYIFIRLM
jgi:hypothetical protein